MSANNKIALALVMLISLNACTTINVDQVRLRDLAELKEGDAMVVLGRHQTPQIQTEASLVSCIGGRLKRGTQKSIRVIPESEFVDSFYPWFEARTAPLHPKRFRAIISEPVVAEKINALNIRYVVWIEGSTERTASAGSMSCTISPAGGGCFGFGTWEDTSDYEATVWDLDTFEEVGRVSTEAVGTSYMPAFVVPIPLLAQVEGDACQGMGKQLVRFFQDDPNALKTLP